tara:strand:- start:298 stop:765 length:468 start_codon:yes stop_codon:yes gene_type:complete
MARSFSYVSNPYTGYRGGYAYRSEDPTFNVQPGGFSKAAGLSTLPSVYKSIKAKSPDYTGITGEYATGNAITDASIIANAGALQANENKLQQLEELQSLSGGSGGGGGGSSGMLSSGLGLLGGVAGSFIPGLGPVGSMAGSFLGKTVGGALEGIF